MSAVKWFPRKIFSGFEKKYICFTLGRLVIVSAAALGLATIANWMHYLGYWKGTIRRVQTVDFNILSHMLPTKLSHVLIEGELEELQRTLDSNYGLFGIVVTNCQTAEPDCPNQEILYTSNSKYAWKQQLNLATLSQFPYNTLQDPPPIFTEVGFDNSSDEIWEPTNKINQGKIIGRVYYVRGIPPEFGKDYGNWFKQLPGSFLSNNGASKYYALTVSLFMMGGITSWWTIERILLQKRLRERLAQEEQIKLRQENTRLLEEAQNLQQQLQDKLKQIDVLITQREQAIAELDKSRKEQEQKTQRLESAIAQLQKQLLQQAQEQHSKTQFLGYLQQALAEAKQQQNLTEEQLQKRQQEIYNLQQQLNTQEQEKQEKTNILELLELDLQNVRQREVEVREQAEVLNKSLSNLQQERDRAEQKSKTLDAQLKAVKEQTASFETLEEVLNEKETELKGLEEWLQESEIKIEQLVIENNYLKNEIYNLKDNLMIYQDIIIKYNFERANIDKNSEAEYLIKFNSLLELLLAVEQEFSDILRVWDNSKQSLRKLRFKPFKRLYLAFKAIAEIGRKYFWCQELGISMGCWKKAFEEKGFSDNYRSGESEATLNRYGKERTFYYEGEKSLMVKHMTIRKGDYCIQIYFEINHALKKIDIGYCGEHLPYDTQNS